MLLSPSNLSLLHNVVRVTAREAGAFKKVHDITLTVHERDKIVITQTTLVDWLDLTLRASCPSNRSPSLLQSPCVLILHLGQSVKRKKKNILATNGKWVAS